MALQNQRVQAPQTGSRGAYEVTYVKSRSNLLAVAAFTLVNVILALVGSDSYFLFSASVPYFVSIFGRAFFEELGSAVYLIIAGVISLVITGLYFLFWAMTKRHREWLDAATVCFGVDCLGLVLWTVLFGFDASLIIDYVFHAFVMFYLISGSIAAHKLLKMPPAEPVSMEAGIPQMVNETPAGETAEELPAEDVPAEETPAEEPAEEVSAAAESDEAAANEGEPVPDETGKKDYRGKTIPANYYRGLEAVGGKLAFDDRGMTFRSHALNIQTGETRIEYKDILNAQTRGLLTEISVYTKDGAEHRFVVYHRKDVVAFLESVKG